MPGRPKHTLEKGQPATRLIVAVPNLQHGSDSAGVHRASEHAYHALRRGEAAAPPDRCACGGYVYDLTTSGLMETRPKNNTCIHPIQLARWLRVIQQEEIMYCTRQPVTSIGVEPLQPGGTNAEKTLEIASIPAHTNPVPKNSCGRR